MLGTVVVVATLVGFASAWWDNGHMLTAEIARQTLSSSDVRQVDEVLQGIWSKDFPNRSSFSPAATWADFLKCTSQSPYCQGIPMAVNAMDAWHFSDRPYNPQNLSIPQSLETSWYQQPSSIWAVEQAITTFLSAQGAWGWSFMMLFSLHIIGDMHQPLHSVSGYWNNSQFGYLPNGDRGGNAIAISGVPGATNLHALWDSAGGLYTNNAPYNAQQTADLVANASALTRQYPQTSLPEFNTSEFDGCLTAGSFNPCFAVLEGWSNDTYAQAMNVAYGRVPSNFTPGGFLGDTYIATVQKTSQRQLALGGYRLASLIAAILKAAPAAPTVPNTQSAGSAGNLSTNTTVLVVVMVLAAGTAVVYAAMYYKLRSAHRRYTLVRYNRHNDNDIRA